MSRLLAFATLVAIIGCTAKVDTEPAASQPAAAAPLAVVPKVDPQPAAKVLAVAPYPRLQSEELLTLVDPGLDIEASRPELGRLDKQVVDLTDPTLTEPPVIGLPGIAGPGIPDIAVPEFGGRAGALKQPDISDPFAGRKGATCAKLVKDFGGNDASEKAIEQGLAWLAKQQKPDGSWVFDAGGDKNETVAATGLSLLAFLGAGETHKPKGKYQKNVQSGLNWLTKNVQGGGANAGKFNSISNMYGQGIGTLGLCEAYGITKDKALLPSAQAAVNYILRGQGANGSWGYQAGANGDTSIVGWQVQALHVARLTKDIKVDDKVVKKTLAFLDTTGAVKKAAYGYTDNASAAPGTSLTAIGLLCRERLDGWDATNAGLTDGVEGILKRTPLPAQRLPDMYFAHYATQTLREYGDDAWKTWFEGAKKDGERKGGLRDIIVNQQIQKAGANEGSWDPDGGYIGKTCGRIGTTALCVIALEAPYRHLPSLPPVKEKAKK